MNVLDPLEATTRIDDAFLGYLRSTFGPRRPDLRAEYERALHEGAGLTRGPLVQATAPFVSGRSVDELVAAGVLTPEFDRLRSSFPLDRALHLHQDQAIVQSVSHGRNLIVSTGTGSGKTESFLLPIVDHLLREQAAGTLDSPGVRALLLYPMNALANDQVKRLRGLLAPVPEITFGRYTGETKQRLTDAEDDFRQRYPGAELLPNELISRDVMQERPPHILLTNYAMLEYLLLRPADTALFDGPTAQHWRFIVLDEAHVYDGAQGAEVAYLLRRLRERVLESRQGELRCFATSATLGQGESDNPELVRFAGQLFGEPFEWDATDPIRRDVISATRQPLTAETDPAHQLHPETISKLHHAFRSGHPVADLATVSGTTVDAADLGPNEYLFELLSRDGNVHQLRRELAQRSVELPDLARLVFPDDSDRIARTVQLIDLCVNARLHENDAPLLPARYHHFVRSLEGAFVCLHPEHPADGPRVSLARFDHCQPCQLLHRRQTTLFELATCRHCRAEYVVGTPTDTDAGHQRLHRSNDFDPRRRYYLLGEPVDVDDDDGAATTIGSGDVIGGLELCATCGCLTLSAGTCECGSSSPRLEVAQLEPADDARGAIRRCAQCAGRSPHEVLTRFVTGTDAPVAVVATELYQQLPASSEERAADQVGSGRKLLTFSDSRQDAAFFAGYLERTYSRSVQRALIREAVVESSSPLRASDVVEAVLRSAEDNLVLDPDDGRATNRRTVSAWVLGELLAADRRQSLEGTGLVRISLAVPRKYRTPQPLVDLGLEAGDVDQLLQLVLSTIRLGGAITAPDGVDIRDEQFAPMNRDYSIRGRGADRGVLGFVPAIGSLNRRLDILQKLFERRNIEADPVAVLEQLWRYLTDPGGAWASTLSPESSKSAGATWKLDFDRFELAPLAESRLPLRCDTCHQLTWWDLARTCPAWRCGGTVSPVDSPAALTHEHYARLYERLRPIALSAQEHTAQWTAREASSIQDRFVAGDVNVLSCSTTFEMGVDVGDIQAVLLRNMPPGVANYVQRAGRAGRRTDAAALVVTFAQRRNHDRTYFDRPEQMVDGYISTPNIVLDNVHIARRHCHSVAFAKHLRRLADAGEDPSKYVGEFFTADATTTPSEQFKEWLRGHPDDLRASLGRLLPAAVADAVGIDTWQWVTTLLEENDDDPTAGWFDRAEAEVREELERLDALRQEALDIEDGRALERYKYLERTVRSRQLIGFLASRNVLPKYGFPVDVVELDLRGGGDSLAGRLELSRDLKLAITDYAPGSAVVAAKTVWRGTGLATRPDHGWPTYGWAICNECGAFRRALAERSESCHICGSLQVRPGTGGRFVVPIFGFVGARESGSGENRPPKAAFSEPYFSSDDTVPFEPVHGLGASQDVHSRVSRQGRVSMINRNGGAGYQLCTWCGSGEPGRSSGGKSKEHPNPRQPGRKCSGPRANVHLGHEFLTDVVELKFDLTFDPSDAHSLLYALLESTRDLGIKREEVDGTLFVFDAARSPGLVLFDAVPGGAGHAQRIARSLRELMDAALVRVSNCTCGEETSCYSCLRSYGNQRMHESLSRGAARSILEQLVVG